MLKGDKDVVEAQSTAVAYDAALDPEPLLKLRAEDKTLEQVDTQKFLEGIVSFDQMWHSEVGSLTGTGQRSTEDSKARLRSVAEGGPR